ncbi:MAG: hypothetical protein ACOX89_08910, partial [Lutispora sp.]
MSVVKVELKKDGRQIRQSFTGQTRTIIRTIGATTERWTEPVVKISGQMTFVVTATRPDELPITLMSAPNLPRVGATYMEGGSVFANVFYVDGQPRFIGPRGKFWEYEVAYTLGGDFVESNSSAGDGETEETLLSFSTSMELEDWASAVDLDGQWNCNSLGEFFADPILFKTGIITFQYQRREYFNPLALSRQYFQAVNSSAWHGFAPGLIKCSDISFNATQTASGTTYDTTYKLQYRPRGWVIDKANSGFYYMSEGSKVRALNDDGSPTDQPILLALDGSKLAAGATVPMKPFRVNP